MADFAQHGVIGTLHNLRHRSTEELEAELLMHAPETPMSLVLPCLYSELEGDALTGIVDKLAKVPYPRKSSLALMPRIASNLSGRGISFQNSLNGTPFFGMMGHDYWKLTVV